MWAKLDDLKGYKAIKDSFNLIELSKVIKSLIHQFEGHRYHEMALYQAKQIFYTLHKGRGTSDGTLFKTHVTLVEQYGGNIGKDNGGAIRADPN
jgi:hypothetical protein